MVAAIIMVHQIKIVTTAAYVQISTLVIGCQWSKVRGNNHGNDSIYLMLKVVA
jgi:hypothetical protein